MVAGHVTMQLPVRVGAEWVRNISAVGLMLLGVGAIALPALNEKLKG